MGKTDLTSKALTLEWLVTDELQVDDAYQRTVAKSLVNTIQREFSWYAFDPLLIGKRKDGSCWVVDGQTRFAVALQLGHAMMACRVFPSDGKRHEAEVFLLANTKRSVKSFDNWRAALCAEEPETVAINKLVKKFGMAVSYSGHWPNLRCVSKLRDAYAAGVLPECLTVITQAWTGNADALSEAIMGSLYVFFARLPDADIERCITKWGRMSPASLYANAQAAKSATGGSKYKAGAMELLMKYNAGLRSNRLEW